MFKSMVSLISAHSTYWLFSLSKRIRIFLQVKVFRNHSKYEIYQYRELQDSKYVAVLALLPRAGLSYSTRRLISNLITQNFEVIAVVNKNGHESDILKEINDFPISILTRENIGRDFGAYQTGISFLNKSNLYDKVEFLVFANDSTYYMPNSNLSFLNEGYLSSNEWISLFANYQYDFHAQSFFMGFSKRVLAFPEFQTFWRHYYPSNERRYAIQKGEIQLSRILKNRGVVNSAFVSPQLLQRAIDTSAPSVSDVELMFRILVDSSPYVDKYRKMIDIEHVKKAAHWCLMNLNPTHSLGVYLTRVMGLPLKLDLIRNGVCTTHHLISLAQCVGASQLEVSDIQIVFTSQGSPSTRKGIHRLWAKYGLE